MTLIPTPESSQQEKARLAASRLSEQINYSLESLKSNVQIAWSLFWNSPEVSPQEICDQFGANAYKIFQESAFWQAAIKQRDPSYEALVPPKEFVINNDGTVTITEQVVETPESENVNG